MLAIAIKDLIVCLGDLILPLKKNTIWFELSAQKEEIGKQIASILYYQY